MTAQTKIFFVTFIFICLCTYLVGAFVNTSFNLKEWGEFSRFMVGVVGMISALLIAVATASAAEEADDNF